MSPQQDSTNQPNKSVPASALLAFEKLLDMQERPGPAIPKEMREARRICGRWLAVRRVLRGLSPADVARRTGIDVQVIELLELGLADAPPVAPNDWRALCLVLEHGRNDFEQIETVVHAAIGLTSLIDESWLREIEAELLLTPEQVEEPAPTAPASVQSLLGAVPNLGQLVVSLRVLRRSPDKRLSAYEIYKRVTEEEREPLEFAFLPEHMDQLLSLKLVERLEGDRILFQLTDEGERFFLKGVQLLAAQRELAEEQQELAEGQQRLVAQQRRLKDHERQVLETAQQFVTTLSHVDPKQGA